MKELLWKFLFCEKGVTSVEYALIASLIFLAIVGVVSTMSGSVANLFQTVADSYPK